MPVDCARGLRTTLGSCGLRADCGCQGIAQTLGSCGLRGVVRIAGARGLRMNLGWFAVNP